MAGELAVRTRPDRQYRVWQIVTAPLGDRAKSPVRLDELQYRNVIRVAMRDVAPSAVSGNRDQSDEGLRPRLRRGIVKKLCGRPRDELRESSRTRPYGRFRDLCGGR